jgi:hypothetical protein
VIDRNNILDIMEQTVLAIREEKESRQTAKLPKRGMLVAQIRTGEAPAQWESSIRTFHTFFRAPCIENGVVVDKGDSNDCTVHAKIAYVHRTGKNSGAPVTEVWGDEAKWKGAVISEDGNCICGFSGFSEDDDMRVAEAGIAEYNRQRSGK